MTDLSKPLTAKELDDIEKYGFVTGEFQRLLAMARSSLSGIEAEPVAWRFELGSPVQPRDGGVVHGEIIDFNADQTGALVRWNTGEEIWKNLRNLEPYLSPPTKGGEGRELVEAAKAVLELPVAMEQIAVLDRGIGTATPNAAWLRLRAAIASTEQG